MDDSLKHATFFLLMIQSFSGFGQSDIIYLKNGSLEVNPKGVFFRQGDWYDCGVKNFPIESPPDIHSNTGLWEVSTKAENGFTFVGLAVRDNGSYESISQIHSIPLQRLECYTLSISIARSPKYISTSRKTRKLINYNEPTILRIYGGNGHCVERELLAESIPIITEEWVQYTFKLKPKHKTRSLTFQAYFKTDSVAPYNGHILIDNIFPIAQIACDN